MGLLLTLLLAQSDPSGPIVSTPATSRASDPFLVTQTFSFPTASADRVPLCTDDSTCVAVCYVGAVTGSTTLYECKGNNGAAFGTVTDPGGTMLDTFIPGLRAREFLHDGFGNAFTLASSTLDSVFAVGQPYTVIHGGFARPNGDVLNWMINRKGGTSGNFNLYQGPGNKSICSGSNVVVTNTGQIVDGWGFTACSRSGGTNYKGYHQYDETSVTDVAAEPSISGTGTWTFGDRSSAAGLSAGLGGPIAFVAFYNVQKTAAQMTVIREKFQGSYSPFSPLTGLSSQTMGVDNTATTGNVDMIYAGSAIVSGGGLITSRGFTNFMASGSVLGASGVSVGTPITSGSYAGPFKTWQFANEGANMEDDDAAAYEGKEGLTHGVAIGWQNGSAYLSTGATGTTTNQAQGQWVVPGGTATPASCNWTITSTPTRYQCVTNITGVPTSIKFRYVVGFTAAVTGSIKVYQSQATVGPALEQPVTNGTALGGVNYVVTASGWPSAALGGRHEVIHTPKFDPLTQWIAANGYTYRLWDPIDAAVFHAGTLIHGYTAAGTYYAQGILTNSVGLTTGQLYASSVEWRPIGAGKCNFIVRHNSCGAASVASCRATAQVNSDVTGTKDCPSNVVTATMGDRYDLTSSVSLIVNRVTVSVLK